MSACKCMDEISSTAMLTARKSTGITPEVNFGNVYHSGNVYISTKVPTLVLKPRGDITRSLKQGYQWQYNSDRSDRLICFPKID